MTVDDAILEKVLESQDGVSVNLDGVDVDEILEFLKVQFAAAAKVKSARFQDLRKVMGHPRVQQDVEDAQENYFAACRDSEEVEANMSRVRRADAARKASAQT